MNAVSLNKRTASYKYFLPKCQCRYSEGWIWIDSQEYRFLACCNILVFEIFLSGSILSQRHVLLHSERYFTATFFSGRKWNPSLRKKLKSPCITVVHKSYFCIWTWNTAVPKILWQDFFHSQWKTVSPCKKEFSAPVRGTGISATSALDHQLIQESPILKWRSTWSSSMENGIEIIWRVSRFGLARSVFGHQEVFRSK